MLKLSQAQHILTSKKDEKRKSEVSKEKKEKRGKTKSEIKDTGTAEKNYDTVK